MKSIGVTEITLSTYLTKLYTENLEKFEVPLILPIYLLPYVTTYLKT